MTPEREAFDKRAVANKRIARQRNVAIAEGFIHTSKGVIFMRDGTGHPKGGRNGKR